MASREKIDAVALTPPEALTELSAGDVAIGGLDVLPTLDGVEPALAVLDTLDHCGVRVLNAAVSLIGTHDKLATAHRLRRAALAAAAALGMDFVGVDLLPTGEDAFVVLELNGAVDLDERYSLPGGDVFADAAAALGIDGTSVGGDVRHLSA